MLDFLDPGGLDFEVLGELSQILFPSRFQKHFNEDRVHLCGIWIQNENPKRYKRDSRTK